VEGLKKAGRKKEEWVIGQNEIVPTGQSRNSWVLKSTPAKKGTGAPKATWFENIPPILVSLFRYEYLL
jgi:hypothetical protein